MEMTKTAQVIKTELELQLKKQGSSLEEFEQSLQRLNTGEGVYKVAAELAPSFGLASIPELAIKGSLAGGAMAGLTMDEMDKSVDSLNKALDREREKVKLVRQLTQNLKREHGFV
jgi:hypothetical protein